MRSKLRSPAYKWVALTNTTLGMLMATINGSITIISLPAIFRGIGLDPLGAGNISYLLWILIGYLLVTAALVVSFGRLGDIYGRVRLYNTGFLVFTAGSVALALDPATGGSGALWLIGWRVVQGCGAAMLLANSTAIVTDAFPATQRGLALGINQIAGLAGSFIGLVTGGLLSQWDWRAVFFVSVPIGVIGTVWAYHSLREMGRRVAAPIDWWGNLTFAAGLLAVLAALTYGIQPYGGSSQGWGNPAVLAGLIGGLGLLAIFCVIEARTPQPMFNLTLFRGPLSGHLSDRHGARAFASGGLLLSALSFLGLLLIPVDFTYWQFAVLLALNGIGSGLFSAPNTTAIMNAVPATQRGSASGMRATFQNAGTTLSIGLFFSLMIAGLASSLPHALTSGLTAQGVPSATAVSIGNLPPVGSLFAAFLGFNPVQTLVGPHVLALLPVQNAATLTGKQFFPHLISQPFHDGLIIVFTLAIAMMLVAALASLLRGRRYLHGDETVVDQIGGEAFAGVAPSTIALSVGPLGSGTVVHAREGMGGGSR
jgi:MFS family permease